MFHLPPELTQGTNYPVGMAHGGFQRDKENAMARMLVLLAVLLASGCSSTLKAKIENDDKSRHLVKTSCIFEVKGDF